MNISDVMNNENITPEIIATVNAVPVSTVMEWMAAAEGSIGWERLEATIEWLLEDDDFDVYDNDEYGYDYRDR